MAPVSCKFFLNFYFILFFWEGGSTGPKTITNGDSFRIASRQITAKLGTLSHSPHLLRSLLQALPTNHKDARPYTSLKRCAYGFVPAHLIYAVSGVKARALCLLGKNSSVLAPPLYSFGLESVYPTIHLCTYSWLLTEVGNYQDNQF